MSQESKFSRRDRSEARYPISQHLENEYWVTEQRLSDQAQQPDDIPSADACKWWARLDKDYFHYIERKEYLDCRDLTTSDRLLKQFQTGQRPFESYFREKIINRYGEIEDTELLHVLFKYRDYYCLASYDVEQGIPSYSDHKLDAKEYREIKITPIPSTDRDNSKIREIKLNLVSCNDDYDLCKTAQMLKNSSIGTEEDKFDLEIGLWEKELCKASQENSINWNQLVQRLREQKQPLSLQGEVREIQQKLQWVVILKYFEHGHADKTKQMLETLLQAEKQKRPPKSSNNTKKFFETDCKICFCSFNCDSNQVLYCDECNTSFHLACYGLQEIPKEDKYYCDCCRFQRMKPKAQNTERGESYYIRNDARRLPQQVLDEPKCKIKKVCCQLCYRHSFPIKRIDQHFYHVTCLMLLNLIIIKNGTIALRNGIDHRRILELVVENQINSQGCPFCSYSSQRRAQLGMRLRCAWPGCQVSMHPICAYINGCKFELKRTTKEILDVQLYCDNHDSQRDTVYQTYLRRYMCNQQQTSSLTFEQFRAVYEQEMLKRRQSQLQKTELIDLIIARTNVVKRYMIGQKEAKSQAKDGIQTESRKILQMKIHLAK